MFYTCIVMYNLYRTNFDLFIFYRQENEKKKNLDESIPFFELVRIYISIYPENNIKNKE
jgi:hypothetical protein